MNKFNSKVGQFRMTQVGQFSINFIHIRQVAGESQ